MVLTRSQTRADAVPTHGTSPPRYPAERVSITTIADSPQETHTSRPTTGAMAPVEVERLGRGCRVHRERTTLDEEYLRQSYMSGSQTQRRGRAEEEEEEAEFIIHQRYPEREAAKRAMTALEETIRESKEGVADDDDDDDDDSRSSPSNHFTFRHHPELARDMKGGGRGRRTSSGSSSSSSSEDDDDDDDKVNARRAATRPAPRGSQGSWASVGGEARHDGRNSGKRLRHGSISPSSSISRESLRNESIDRLEQQDAVREADQSSSTDGDESDAVSPAEVRHARRKAKEAVEKNINIKYYMADALGPDDSHGARRRKYDRRYRHLLAAAAEGEDDALATNNNNNNNNTSSSTTNNNNNAGLGDICPLSLSDTTTFDSVGGLPAHILLLREVVLLPLMYPQLLQRMHVKPPRGVLFVGPPGTGKTLMARALAGEGGRVAGQHTQPVAFFMRKGADILSKWVGESEKQLTMLFDEAKRQQPSIIFFDEIDGLAPMRHAKTEQSHAALVATLLALLDGLDDRGQVVVIGATNRPDTIDPALRRPGRFDRELLFPLPDAAARAHILGILTHNTLPGGPTQRAQILDELVHHTESYSGADLKALTTEASLHRLRLALPQLYTSPQRCSLPENVEELLAVRRENFFAAAQRIAPSIQRSAGASGAVGGGSSAALAEDYVEHLCRHVREEVLGQVGRRWPPVQQAMQREARDCGDVGLAVKELTSFPVPHARQAMLLFLHVDAPSSASSPSSTSTSTSSILRTICRSICRALPSFKVFMVHLPMMHVGFHELSAFAAQGHTAMGATNYAQAVQEVSGGHIFHLVQALQAQTWSIVQLCGAEEWLADQGLPDYDDDGDGGEVVANMSEEEREGRRQRMVALRYYIHLLAETEVLVVCPCASPRTQRAILGKSARPMHSTTTSNNNNDKISAGCRTVDIQGGDVNQNVAVMEVGVAPHPSREDLRAFVSRIFYTLALALHVQSAAKAAVLAQQQQQQHGSSNTSSPDLSSPSPITSPAEQQRRRAAAKSEMDLWRKVEYRRLQLRHVLLKWVTQYVIRFRAMNAADLDLVEGTPLWKEWQRHTHGQRIGLHDVLERLENEEYVCLSQYFDDVDQIVRNVRTFFTSRSAMDQKYRLRAMDLKETAVLSLYKINRNMVRFCEAHRHVVEPQFSSDEDGEGGGGGGGGASSQEHLRFAQRTHVRRAKRRRRCEDFGRRRRRRPQPTSNTNKGAELQPTKDASGQDCDDDDDDGVVGGEVKKEEVEEEEASSPTEASRATLEAAVNLLSRFTYDQLLALFRWIMMFLEEAVQQAESAPAPQHTTSEEEEGPTTRPEERLLLSILRDAIVKSGITSS